MNASARTVEVVGAGVLGLTTGVVLAEAGWAVRIRTDAWPSETTSAVAGAMWGPAMLRPVDRVLAWGTRSYREFVALAEDETSGVHLGNGRIAARFDLGGAVPPESELVPDLRRCEPEELPAGFVSGYWGSLPLIDMPHYLEYLVRRFRAAGGEMLLSPVMFLADAAGDAPVVVNCTGVGAHELVGDPGVYPVRGQHVVVRNPGVDEYFIELSTAEEFVGYVPHGDRLVLGGQARQDEWNARPDPDLTTRILRRCAEVEPKLAGVPVEHEVVGLRPGRYAVRLDVEEYAGARVVHSYGHAGNGVALSWGCAYEAAELAAG